MGWVKSSAFGVVVVTLAAAVYTLVAGNQPLLGLDLQGGVSVVLQPTAPVDPGLWRLRSTSTRSRWTRPSRSSVRGWTRSVFAEPEISRQGETIVVDLPGVKEQQRALELVGQTAELRFRPVIFDLGPELELDESTTTTDGTTTTTEADDDEESQGGIVPRRVLDRRWRGRQRRRRVDHHDHGRR